MMMMIIIIIIIIKPGHLMIENNAELVLYADDTSFIITNPNPTDFANNVNKIFF